MTKTSIAFSLAACAVLALGCDHAEPARDEKSHVPSTAAPTNRIDIPANVQQNLGMTFAKVERRAVKRTLRLPGAFELLPTASREYRAGAAGKIELMVRQYDRVEAGQVVGRLESQRLRELQQQLADAATSVTLAQAAVDSMPPFFDAHDKHHAEIEKSVELWNQRVHQLEEVRLAGGGQASELAAANAALANARADYAETLEKEAELNARKIENEAQLAAAHQRFDLLLATLASLTGHSIKALSEQTHGGNPLWQTLASIEYKATEPGVISVVGATNGSYVESAAHLLTVIAPDQVRFRARGFQSDLGRLKTGLPARVVPPAGTDIADTTPMKGILVLAPQAAADARTIDLIVTPTSIADWAIDGVSGFVEITLTGNEAEELAIPMACVVRDGVTPILFRRDPRDPDKVIRIDADVGANDGRWVVIQSGIAEGNEIVQDGAYQLLVATSGTIQKGGHFHPDGSFHEGED